MHMGVSRFRLRSTVLDSNMQAVSSVVPFSSVGQWTIQRVFLSRWQKSRRASPIIIAHFKLQLSLFCVLVSRTAITNYHKLGILKM